MRFLPAVLTFAFLAILSPARGEAAPPYAKWGAENLESIRKDLWLPKRNLYAEMAPDDKGVPSHPSFMWGVGVQLSALAGASAVEPEKYLSQTTEYADAIQVYWLKHNGVEGFDVQPGPKQADRYYDDNAWLVLALSEVFEVSKDKKYLDRAIATFDFVMTGEDDKLGGGLYWREQELRSKNTCTNAPSIVSALRLHQLTKDDKYLEIAKRLYAWTNSHLQDTDGLYWDNIRMDGRVNRRKFTYNSALMIRANCLFHEITGEARYLDEAKRIATASEKQWVRGNGAVADSGKFAHLLMESYLALYQRDKDKHWAETVERTLTYVHDNLLGANGRYSHSWERPAGKAREESMLLNQAGPARIYWVAAKALQP
ncbi:MAG: hypothetical protein EOP88_19300 [Verrucomicrobiaceae bacterium]|nr:MAG: hypothetical protein EOP88_19300 [Verrucomicrobiaceae bacterium]